MFSITDCIVLGRYHSSYRSSFICAPGKANKTPLPIFLDKAEVGSLFDRKIKTKTDFHADKSCLMFANFLAFVT